MTEMRMVFHRCEGADAPGMAEALAVKGNIDLCAGPLEAAQLAFTLSWSGSAILVHDSDGIHIGIFADLGQAVAHGFDMFDRAVG